MTALITFIVFGLVGGLIINSVMQSRSALGGALSVVLGIIGSVAAGFVFFIFAKSLVGDGLDYIVTLFAAAAGGLILPLIGSLLKK